MEVNGEFAYGAVTLPEEDNDIILHFAENYYVYGFSPEIIENPDKPGSLLISVDALRWAA